MPAQKRTINFRQKQTEQRHWAVVSSAAWIYSRDLHGSTQALADWAEAQALHRLEQQCSNSSLIRQLRQDPGTCHTVLKNNPKLRQSNGNEEDEAFEDEPEDDLGERNCGILADEVFSILADRAETYGAHGYPFKIDDDWKCLSVVQRSSNNIYKFLLSLSYCDPVVSIGSPVKMTGAQL